MFLKLLLLFLLPLIQGLQLNKPQKKEISSRREYQTSSRIDAQDILVLSIEVQTKDQQIQLQIDDEIKSIDYGKRYFNVIQDDQAK